MVTRPNPRFPFAAACLAGLTLLTGCGWTGRNTATDSLSARSTNEKQFADAKRGMKNPEKVFLAYARMQEDTGRAEQARQSYQFVLKEEPRSLEAMLGLARLEALAGRDAEAERGFQIALDAHPQNAYAHDAYGQFLAQRQRWDEALPALDRAVNLSPDEPTIRYHFGVTLARSGDLDAARTQFTRALGEAEAHYNIGYLLRERGRHREAEREFAAAVRLRPDLEPAKQLLAEYRPDTIPEIQLASGTDQRRHEPAGAVRTAHANVARSLETRSKRTDGVWSPDMAAEPQAGDGLTPTQLEQLRNQY